MEFVPFFDWVDVPDPENPPVGAKQIESVDLLRWENGLADARDEINGIPAELEALEGQVTLESVSANLPTRLGESELSATIAEGVKQGRSVTVYSDFTTAPDGAPATADSGQDWIHTNGWAGDTGANLRVINGKLTNTTTAAATRAGYVTADAVLPVTRMGAEWVWESSAAGVIGGSVTLVNWMTPLPEGTIGPVPSASMHLVISGASVLIGIFDNGSQTMKVSRNWPSPPALDGVTEYRVEAIIDRSAQTVTVTLPWGEIVSYSDPRVATLSGQYACWESYLSDASTRAKFGFTEIWADSLTETGWERDVTPSKLTQELSAQHQLVTAQYTDAVTDVKPKPAQMRLENLTTPIPSTATAIDPVKLAVAFEVPASGQVLLEMSMYVKITTKGRLIWQFAYGATVSGQIIPCDEVRNGIVFGRRLVTGLTPGTSMQWEWRHWLIDGGVGTVNITADTPAVMSVTAA